jgi:hypothetical protein
MSSGASPSSSISAPRKASDTPSRAESNAETGLDIGTDEHRTLLHTELKRVLQLKEEGENS